MTEPLLTIGMCTVKDYHGVYFSVQAMRLYHREVMDQIEFLIIDNGPEDDGHRKCLKNFLPKIKNGRMVVHEEKRSTSVRNEIFKQAKGKYVMSLDCHVLVEPGAIARLIEYFERNPDTGDLLQGPLQYDDLGERSVATHWEPRWQEMMYGVWQKDPRGVDRNADPFDIPLCGLGLFACRKDAWLGFHELFTGFGGEEGYIHEKYRQAGRRCLCLPFLRWLHRFDRPDGPGYVASLEDRLYNYFVGWLETGQDINPVIDHFATRLPKGKITRILDKARKDLSEYAQKKSDKVSLSELMEAAQQLVQQLLSLPVPDRQLALSKLKAVNEACYALVLYQLDKLRNVSGQGDAA